MSFEKRFDEKYGSFESCEFVNNADRKRLLAFFQSEISQILDQIENLTWNGEKFRDECVGPQAILMRKLNQIRKEYGGGE